MSDRKYLRELLLQLKKTKSGQLDVKMIPAEHLDDVLHALNSLFRFNEDSKGAPVQDVSEHATGEAAQAAPGNGKHGLTTSSELAGSLPQDERDVLDSLVKSFDAALVSGKVSLHRHTNNHIGPVAGPNYR